jgi:hypothetical protein
VVFDFADEAVVPVSDREAADVGRGGVDFAAVVGAGAAFLAGLIVGEVVGDFFFGLEPPVPTFCGDGGALSLAARDREAGVEESGDFFGAAAVGVAAGLFGVTRDDAGGTLSLADRDREVDAGRDGDVLAVFFAAAGVVGLVAAGFLVGTGELALLLLAGVTFVAAGFGAAAALAARAVDAAGVAASWLRDDRASSSTSSLEGVATAPPKSEDSTDGSAGRRWEWARRSASVARISAATRVNASHARGSGSRRTVHLVAEAIALGVPERHASEGRRVARHGRTQRRGTAGLIHGGVPGDATR